MPAATLTVGDAEFTAILDIDTSMPLAVHHPWAVPIELDLQLPGG